MTDTAQEKKQTMTPIEVVVLLHYFYSTEEYPSHYPAIMAAKEKFVRLDVLKRIDPDPVPATGKVRPALFEVTDKGAVLVSRICSVPMPVQRIIWE